MKRNSFINSPLEKGDTGGCFYKKASILLKAEFYKGLFQKKLYENLVRTTPSAPFIKGEFFRNLPAFPCPANLWVTISLAKSVRFATERGEGRFFNNDALLINSFVWI